jgi:hypothetical protein
MNPATTLTFFYLGKIRLVDLCFYIIAQVAGVFATLFGLSRLLPEPVTHPAVNYLISMSGFYCAKLFHYNHRRCIFGASFRPCWPKNGPEGADSQYLSGQGGKAAPRTAHRS